MKEKLEPRNHESLVALQNRDFMYLGYGICHWDMDIFCGDHVEKWGISASNQQVCSGRRYHKHGKLVNPRKLNAGL